MKTENKILVILIVMSLFLGCSNTEDSQKSSVINQENPIRGEWNMVKLQGGFSGVDNVFVPGDIIWFFNDNSTLTIENNIESNNVISGLSSGVYNYSIVTNGDNSFLVIDNVNLGQCTFSQEGLILDQNVSIENGTVNDAMVIYFER